MSDQETRSTQSDLPDGRPPIKDDAYWKLFFARQAASQKAWRLRNADKVREYSKRWHAANKEKVKAYHSAYNKRRWQEIKQIKARLKIKQTNQSDQS